jgi:hypothetical protein
MTAFVRCDTSGKWDGGILWEKGSARCDAVLKSVQHCRSAFRDRHVLNLQECRRVALALAIYSAMNYNL